jgi:hypothetical protein
MERREQREVVVKYCDLCAKEAQHFNKCAICKKEMCNEDGGKKHAAYHIELFRYSDGQRLIAHVCGICAERHVNLAVWQLLNGMMGDEPVPVSYHC